MLKKSLKISSQGYPVFLKLVDFIVINVVLIFSAHLLGLVPFNTIAILSLLFSIFFLLFAGNDSNLLIVFYVQIMPDDFVMQLHRF